MKKTAYKNKFLEGALYLSLAGVISKVLSAMYRIPLQNLTGDVGFYTYQQIYPFIGIVMILALYGFPQAISKLVAESNGHENISSKRLIFLSLFIINGALAIIFFVFAPYFAQFIADESLMTTYRWMSALFLLLPFLAYLRGQAQGVFQMIPTAVSQVTEQFIRVVIIVISAILIFKDVFPIEAIGLFAIYASIFSMFIAMIVLWVLKDKKQTVVTHESTALRFAYVFKTVFFLGFLGASTHMILLWLQLVDVFSIVPGLLKSGVSLEEAKVLKGTFDRGQPLIQFGVVIGSSFALALIPSVVKKEEVQTHAIQEALTFGIYLASAASLGLFILMPEVNRLLFMDTAGTVSLRVLGLSILLTTLIITLGAVIQAVYSVMNVFIYLLVAVFVKYGLNTLFVPLFGIVGSAWATVMSLMILTGLLIWKLKRYKSKLAIFKPIKFKAFSLGLLTMTLILWTLKGLIHSDDFSRYTLAIYVFSLIIIGAACYLSILLKYRVFTMKQLQILPLGSKMITLMERFEKGKVKNDKH